MSTQEPNRNAPFALPLRAGDYDDDILDGNEKQIATMYGDERDPKTAAQRDYVIAAVNSFPLLEEMRKRLEVMTRLAEAAKRQDSTEPLPGCDGRTFSENIHASRELLARADAIEQGKPSR